jgi:ketosteroid isomerase-like protein
MSELEEIRAVANKLFDGIESGNVAVLREVYAPNVEIWHNTDLLVQTVDDNVKTLEGFVGRIDRRRYEDRRLDVFPGGFVQQHKLTGVRKDGVRVELHACIVCKVLKGRITRLDEYFDSAAVEKFRKAV